MVRPHRPSPPRRRRPPPPWQPRMVAPPLFKRAVRQAAEERARELRTQLAVDGGVSARYMESPPRRAGRSAGSPALEAGNGGASFVRAVDLPRPAPRGGSACSMEAPPRRAGLSAGSGTPPLEAGNGDPSFVHAPTALGGHSTRSPQPPSLVDEVNHRKNQEAVEDFLAELSARSGLLMPPPPLPLSEREPTPPPPTSPPPSLPVLEPVPSPPTHRLPPLPDFTTLILDVCTPEDAHMAVAAWFAEEKVHVRVSPDMILKNAEEVKEILSQVGLPDEASVLDAKVSQARWLKNLICNGRREVERLEGLLSVAAWL